MEADRTASGPDRRMPRSTADRLSVSNSTADVTPSLLPETDALDVCRGRDVREAKHAKRVGQTQQ